MTLVAIVILCTFEFVSPAPLASGQQDAPRPALGVNSITLREPATRNRDLDLIKKDGFTYLRVPVEWPIVEASPGVYDWSESDSIIRGARQRGLLVIGVLTYTPSWAAVPVGPEYLHPGPKSAGPFANFARLAAERYRGQVNAWEIWNEPNIVASYAPRADATMYSSLLKAAYPVIKAADPAALVLTGGTAPAVDSATQISPASFVRSLYLNGAGNSFDAVSMHPYSGTANLSAPTVDPSSSQLAISAVTATLAANGQSQKKIWFTEFGASSSATYQYGVSEARQAEILADGISYLHSLPNSGPIIIFDYRDFDSSSTNGEFHFGLRRTDFSTKPAYFAVRNLLATMGP